MRRFIPVLGLALIAAAGTATAQSPVGLRPSVYAGIAFPTGDNSDAFNSGFTLGGALDLHTAANPLSFRGELSYTRFEVKDDGFGTTGNINDVSGRVNAVYALPAAGFSPYAIGGFGLYHVSGSATNSGFTASNSENKFGWNIGAGIDLPLGNLASRIEIRYHSVSMDNGNYTYLPITFGIRF